MGTFYSSTYKNCRCKCTYSVSSNGITTTVSGTIYLQHKGAAIDEIFDVSAGVSLSEFTSKPGFFSVTTTGESKISKHTDWTNIHSKKFSFTETQERAKYSEYLHIGIEYITPYGTKYETITIPAKTSYSVKYYLNGELWMSGTKYYGENYYLSSLSPMLIGYKFDRWNTQPDGSGTYYSPGDVYATNTALTLYAICYAVPVISSISAVRYNSSDEEDPYGDRARITCTWSIQSETAVLTGRIIPDGGTASSFLFSSGHSGTSGTAIATISSSNGMAIDTDTQYIIEVTATNNSFASAKTVVNEILTRAYYVMDFKAGGLGVGIGRAAPENGLEIGYETTFDEDVNFYKDGMFTGDVYSGGSKLSKEGHTHVVGDITDMPLSKDHFKVVTYSAHSSTSVGTTGASATYNIVEPGYYPLGVVGFYISNANVLARACYLNNISDGSATINYYMRSVSGTNTVTQTTRVLWVKI